MIRHISRQTNARVCLWQPWQRLVPEYSAFNVVGDEECRADHTVIVAKQARTRDRKAGRVEGARDRKLAFHRVC